MTLTLLTAGVAVAQDFSVSVLPPEDATSVSAGDSTTVSVDVNLQGENFYCTGEVELPVQVSASGGSDVTATPASETVTFTTSANIYNENTEAFNQTQPVDVTTSAGSGASSGSTQVTVTATFEGGDYTPDCGPQAFNSDEASAPYDVNVQGTSTDDGGTDGTDGGAGGNGTDGGDDGSDDGNGIPGPGALAPLAVVGAAMLARARR